MEHTKEPWLLNRYGTAHVGDDSRPVVLTGFALNTGHSSPIAESNTRRIVACVNACADVQTEFLEQISVDKLRRDWLELKQQRDELLMALKQIQATATPLNYAAGYTAMKRIADAAIAKVKP